MQPAGGGLRWDRFMGKWIGERAREEETRGGSTGSNQTPEKSSGSNWHQSLITLCFRARRVQWKPDIILREVWAKEQPKLSFIWDDNLLSKWTLHRLSWWYACALSVEMINGLHGFNYGNYNRHTHVHNTHFCRPPNTPTLSLQPLMWCNSSNWLHFISCRWSCCTPSPLCPCRHTHTHTHTHTLQHKVRGVMIKDWQVAVERSGVVVPGKAAAVSGVASARDGVSAPGIAAAPVTAPCELLLRGFLLTRSQTRTRRANRHKCCQTYDVYIHLTHETRRHFESCVLFNHLFITL